MIQTNRIYNFIGKKIKEKREKAGITQSQLAESIDKSRASLANYESGDQAIYISDLYLIADYFKADIFEFLPSLDEVQVISPEKILNDAKSKHKDEILGFINSLKSDSEPAND